MKCYRMLQGKVVSQTFLFTQSLIAISELLRIPTYYQCISLNYIFNSSAVSNYIGSKKNKFVPITLKLIFKATKINENISNKGAGEPNAQGLHLRTQYLGH